MYLFYFVFEGNFQAPGAYIRRGDLTKGFLRYEFGGAYCWFSHYVTKPQTTKLSFLLRFYFHGVLEQLKTNFQTNFRLAWRSIYSMWSLVRVFSENDKIFRQEKKYVE